VELSTGRERGERNLSRGKIIEEQREMEKRRERGRERGRERKRERERERDTFSYMLAG